LGILIGTFFDPETQKGYLGRLWEAVRAPFTRPRRCLQVVLFILVLPPLWFTLGRLEYATEVIQFFSGVPVQVWLIPLTLLLGFVLEMVVEKVVSSGVRRWPKGKVITKTPDAVPPSDRSS
jgi:hypothetical protein